MILETFSRPRVVFHMGRDYGKLIRVNRISKPKYQEQVLLCSIDRKALLPPAGCTSSRTNNNTMMEDGGNRGKERNSTYEILYYISYHRMRHFRILKQGMPTLSVSRHLYSGPP